MSLLANRPLRLLITTLALVGLAGCFGEGDGPESIPGTPQQPIVGLLVDAPVSGVDYVTSAGAGGTTNAQGEFEYIDGDSVTFSIGDIALGTVAGAPIVTPVELTRSSDPNDPAALNMLVFLQSLDSDADPSNGIAISTDTQSRAAGQALDFEAADFGTQVATVIAAITEPDAMIVSESQALINFYETYAAMGGTDAFSFVFAGFPPVGTGASFELVFADEFNTDGAPDANKWNFELGYGPDNFGWGNNEWQLYTDSADNVRVEDGNLVIQARCDTPPCGVRDGTVTSARITTQDKFEFKFGKVVARIKPPVGKGAWPAFWALGANFPETPWPRAGEIDFMEMHNAFSNERTTHSTVHWCDQSIQAPATCTFPDGWVFDSQNREFPTSLGDDFHIWEADWDGSRIVASLDGVAVFTREIEADTMEEFLREFFMILNVAMGGTLGSNGQPPAGDEVWPQTMLVDYVRVYQRDAAEAFSTDFEDAAESYDFGVDGGFGGGAAAIVDNPFPEGINTSAQVGRMLKFAGEVFGGSSFLLPTSLDIAAGTSFTMKVWSQRAVPVTFKLEGGSETPEVEVMHSGSGWEELTFDFGSFAGIATIITLIFDLDTVGDAANNPDDWTFYFDDITQILPEPTDPGGSLTQIDLPITFDDATVDYTVVDFGGAASTLIADPTDASNFVMSSLKPAGSQVFAGTTMNTAAGLANAIPFTPTATTIGIRVYSPDAGIPVLLKAEDLSDSTISVETEAFTSVANEWETLVFDFSSQVTGPALDVTQSYRKLSVFFNFGTDGDTAGEKRYLWDDVEFGVLPPPVDDTPPTLTALTITSNNADPTVATIGDDVTLTLTADEPIMQPTITIGGVAAMVTGAGTSWSASRTLDSNDTDGVIAYNVAFGDLAGNAGTAVTATTDGSLVMLDSLAPTVVIGGAPVEFTTLDAIALTFAFSEAVTGVALVDISVTNGAASDLVAVDAATYTANVTPNGAGDLLVAVNAGAGIDSAGNLSEMATAVTIPSGLDADAPLLTVVTIASDNANPAFARTGDIVTISMTANEPIAAPTVSIGGLSADVVTGADTVWTASRTMLASETEAALTFLINFEDVGGNAGPQSSVTTNGSSVTFDITEPTVAFGDVAATLQTLDPFTATLTFSEDVTGFDESAFTVTNGTAATFAAVDSANYTIVITPDGVGDLTIDVAADSAMDGAGNGNLANTVSAALDLGPTWQLVWSDGFDGAALDAANWTARNDADCPDPCTGEQTYNTANVSVAAGLMTIEGRELAGPIYSSGLIDTRGKFEFTHGRIEIDARMPGTLGALPSLYLLPVTDTYGPWPQSGEIDLANAPDLAVGGNASIEHTLQYGLPVPENTSTTVSSDPASAPSANTLTYALEWEAGEMRWFVDGVHVATQTQGNWYSYSENADGVYTLGTGAAPFDQDFYLAIGLAIADNVGAGSTFPQALEIDAVRIYECANAIDPVAGSGCSTADPGIVAVVARSEPYTEMLELYTDALATLDFVDPTTPGVPSAITLQASAYDDGFGAVVQDTVATDGTDTYWNVDLSASIGTAGVTIDAQNSGFFDLDGSETAGELQFRMRITAASGTPQLRVGLTSAGTGRGVASLDPTADGEWHQYSVKIADLVTDSVDAGTTLDVANLVNPFLLEVRIGNVTLDLDDIKLVSTCRDDGGCEATPRLPAVEVQYSQDFESVDAADVDALSVDVQGPYTGWDIFANVFQPDGVTYIRGYGSFPAPNGGAGFSAVAVAQGGPDQGTNQLSVYNDYNNGPDQTAGNRVEANLFHERAIVAADAGQTVTLNFDAKRGNINDPMDDACVNSTNPPCDSTALAFIKTLDPASGFVTTSTVTLDTTDLPETWSSYSISLTIDPTFVDQILQFGFTNVASNFEPSAVFYDNVEFVVTVTAP